MMSIIDIVIALAQLLSTIDTVIERAHCMMSIIDIVIALASLLSTIDTVLERASSVDIIHLYCNRERELAPLT